VTTKKYDVPKNRYFRVHHIRPRFKNDVESVLLFVASEIAGMKELDKEEFDTKLNKAIRRFPGNQIATEKTISNWRTEISSLFGFVLYNPETNKERPSPIAIKLSEKQDLVEFFKFFCFTFQYPGGHLKTQEIKKLIENNIRFKPVKFILSLLDTARKNTSFIHGITKAEATHCIFNDLSVITGRSKASDVLALIEENRKGNLQYDWTGDVIRYAGDILDYMYHANLLKKHGQQYVINEAENESILLYLSDNSYYTGFELYYGKRFEVQDLRSAQINWFNYLATQSVTLKLETDIIAYLGLDSNKYKQLEKLSSALALPEFQQAMSEAEKLGTKSIGDTGESLVHGHECMRLKFGKRADLIPKVVCIPNYLKLGYDIRSFELDANMRCIEVKTTISNTAIDFNKFHLTENEWNVAQSLEGKYYVYRLIITRNKITMFIIRNPVEQYKNGNLKMAVANGVEVSFNEKSGHYEELLQWEN